MYRADFVVGRIAQVGKIEFGHGPFAPAGRVLDALATVGNTGVMKSLDLLGAGAREADGAAIGMRRGRRPGAVPLLARWLLGRRETETAIRRATSDA
jgi:hypothetical protein